MKKLILALTLIPSVAMADILPAGCYVQNLGRTNPCWEPLFSVQWSPSLASTNFHYGTAMANVMRESIGFAADFNQCLADRNYAVNQYNLLATDYNIALDDKDFLLQAYGKMSTYAKKLKKACGVKCKKIKAPKL